MHSDSQTPSSSCCGEGAGHWHHHHSCRCCGLVGGLLLLAVGVLALLQTTGMVDWQLQKYWPVLLVLFGLRVLMRGFCCRSHCGSGKSACCQPEGGSEAQGECCSGKADKAAN